MYRIISRINNREHISYVLAHKNWSDYYNIICPFYRKYFQHETGAFYRVIFKNTLSPEGGRTFEGVHFGNPFEKMSCRTGEFGGFAGRSEEHTSELQSRGHLVCRLLLETK